LCVLDFVIEYFDIFSVEDLNITDVKFRHLSIVEFSGFVFKKPVASTYTPAVFLFSFAAATLLAFVY